MRNSLLIIIVFVSNLLYAQDDKLSQDKAEKIQTIIHLFKTKNIERISEIVNYPLSREYPLTDIKSKQELMKRFNDIFDQSVIDEISKSKITDWAEVGWRGIMLHQGTMWIDTDGKITALNHQSVTEKKQRLKLISEQKEMLHSSLKSFKNPQYKFKTKHYLIRIDELENGKYRYASWKNNQNESAKPDIILINGILEFSGSGGNHTITFKKGNFKYIVYRFHIGASDTPEISLSVEENNKEILNEDGQLLEK
ncbi:hypothetical protein [Chryseobacterium sp. 3008163]|uniref:hypothetical protein n=1 Tax=Chryseobacterium sp. 3008163 TaxID=2478663 RepID=UPI000F0C1C86|nr:hypothetical protein [Chryseobacterium sp. 3008163]AYN02437.1 hypothetical protein EAG08_20900 [Chryseobacterium sp. 3008163]